MMKRPVLAILFAFACGISFAQNLESIDSLKYKLSNAGTDTDRVYLMSRLCNWYATKIPDSSFYYGQKALDLARRIRYPKGEAMALNSLGFAQGNSGSEAIAIKFLLRAREIAEKNNLTPEKAVAIHYTGLAYWGMNDQITALAYIKKAIILFKLNHDYSNFVISEREAGEISAEMNQLDSAIHYLNIAYHDMTRLKQKWTGIYILESFGNIQNKKGNAKRALDYYQQSIRLANEDNNYLSASNTSIHMAKLYQQLNKSDSCIYFARQALAEAQTSKYYQEIIDACEILTQIYEKRDANTALTYNKLIVAAKDSLYNAEKTSAFKSILDFDEQERRYEIETATAAYQNKVRLYASLAGLAVFSLIAFIFYGNNRQKQRANKVLESTLANLKSTQTQLIQSAKMASLGELTAGVAHEIQNPLNFVNNFSEVNKDMLLELETEIKNGNTEDALVLTTDIIQNEEKINHHGKRADGIVKSMLEHSHSRSGQKELIDINVMADEYMRLSYHGLRAKDKSFNAELITHFDTAQLKIEVVPQDIGRVLLNLFNNAFYAVNQKQKTTGEGYKPEVTVTIYKENSQVIIKVKDNGVGIPEAIKEKIMQPFFTTKPTGEGTGLGLSLTYDMVVKGHGGSIVVDTKEGEFTEFIVSLPII
jgi:two-component system NtrC family sensor kinase